MQFEMNYLEENFFQFRIEFFNILSLMSSINNCNVSIVYFMSINCEQENCELISFKLTSSYLINLLTILQILEQG